jgi:hypothetical protein
MGSARSPSQCSRLPTPCIAPKAGRADAAHAWPAYPHAPCMDRTPGGAVQCLAEHRPCPRARHTARAATALLERLPTLPSTGIQFCTIPAGNGLCLYGLCRPPNLNHGQNTRVGPVLGGSCAGGSGEWAHCVEQQQRHCDEAGRFSRVKLRKRVQESPSRVKGQCISNFQLYGVEGDRGFEASPIMWPRAQHLKC